MTVRSGRRRDTDRRAGGPRPAAKPDKPGLTKDRVLEAALGLVDRRGVEALTMRNLGETLSVEAMSLYRYFPSKAALLIGVVDRVLAEVEFPAEDHGWRRDLATMGRSFWRVLDAHPNVVPLLLGTPLNTPGSQASAEAVLRMVGRAGFAPTEAHRIFRAAQAFILGTALMLRASPREPEIRRQVAELTRTGAFPLLRGALANTESFDPEADFEFGFGLLLDAIEASIKAPGPKPGGRRSRTVNGSSRKPRS